MRESINEPEFACHVASVQQMQGDLFTPAYVLGHLQFAIDDNVQGFVSVAFLQKIITVLQTENSDFIRLHWPDPNQLLQIP